MCCALQEFNHGQWVMLSGKGLKLWLLVHIPTYDLFLAGKLPGAIKGLPFLYFDAFHL